MRKKILYLLMGAALVIPAYPASKKTGEEKEVLNDSQISRIYYQSSEPCSNIMQFYIDKLQEMGWAITYKSDDSLSISLTGRDNSALSIQCAHPPQENITYINLSHFPAPTPEAQEAGAKYIDMPGKDIPNIPRYPGAVRRQYYMGSNQEDAIYEVKQSCLDCMVEFYRAGMVAQGWQYFNEIRTTIGKELDFEKMPEWLREQKNEQLKTEYKEGLDKLKQEYPESAEELKKESERLANVPLIILIFGNKTGMAFIVLTQQDNVVSINTNFVPNRPTQK